MSKSITTILFFFLFLSTSFGQLRLHKYVCDTCNVYVITEFNVGVPIGLVQDQINRHFDFSANVGFMYRLNERVGVGGHIFMGAYLNGGWHTQNGIRPRISYYLNDRFHIDFSPGFILYDSPYPEGFAGYSIETSVMWKHWLGVTTRLDLLEATDFRAKNRVLNVGLRADGIKGSILILVAALAAGVQIIVNSN